MPRNENREDRQGAPGGSETGDITVSEVHDVAACSRRSSTVIGHATGPVHTGSGDMYVVCGD
jgi:hypothetical protein